MEPAFMGYFNSPVGVLEICSDGNSITAIRFSNSNIAEVQSESDDIIIKNCTKQLIEYFRGDLKVFDIPISPRGTDFQRKVWDKVLEIPFGETNSYGRIAIALGDAKLNRAVGLANGANPIPIIIPCHRIIGGDGSLTGYAGGLDRKKWLLNHELQHYEVRKGQLKLF